MFSPTAGSGRTPTLPPLPAYIRLPQGEITHVERIDKSPHSGKRSYRSGAQKAGLAYQKKALQFILDSGNCNSVLNGPWYWYSDSSGQRHYCQPDALVVSPGGAFETIAVVEIKLRWTSDAWWQLRRLYLPVLAKVFPTWKLFPLVITRSYDPAIRIPEEVALIDSLCEARERLSSFPVMVWRP